MKDKDQVIDNVKKYIIGDTDHPIPGFALHWFITEIVNQVYAELGIEDPP